MEGEEFGGEIERNLNECKSSPDDESKERCGPDNKEERRRDVFGMSKGLDEDSEEFVMIQQSS